MPFEAQVLRESDQIIFQLSPDLVMWVLHLDPSVLNVRDYAHLDQILSLWRHNS